MRAMFMVTASLLICVGLPGCDREQRTETSTHASVAATAPVCNCPQQAHAPTPIVKRHGHRWHRHWNGGSMSHETSWSEHESSSPSYSPSDASGYATENDSSDESNMMAGAPIPPPRSAAPFPPPPPGAVLPPPPPETQGSVWIDGYGREHYAEDAQEDDGNYAALTAKDGDRRLAPWHAYNVDCDKAQ